MSTNPLTKDEARLALLKFGKFTVWKEHEMAIDAFEAAVRAEALQPREPSPELAEAERWLDGIYDKFKESFGHLVADVDVHPRVIAAELDRLRAENTRLRSGLNIIADHDTGCDRGCEGRMVQHARAVLATERGGNEFERQESEERT